MITKHCPKCSSRMLRDYIQRPGPSAKSRPYMKKGWWCPKCDYAEAEPEAVALIVGFMGIDSDTTPVRLPTRKPKTASRKKKTKL